MPDMRASTILKKVSININPTFFGYNGNTATFDENQPKDYIPLGSVIEFLHTNANAHPLHLHIFPMQVVGTCPGHVTGEYYDTLMTNAVSTDCRVRFLTANFVGRVMLHCHILPHSDTGAMSWILSYVPTVYSYPPVAESS